MIGHTMMSISGFKEPPGFWPLSFRGAGYAPYLTLESNLMKTWVSWMMTFWSLTARFIQKLNWMTWIVTQARIYRARALLLLRWPSILSASLTAIPIQLVTVTAITIPARPERIAAIAIPARPIILMTKRTATLMTNAVLGLRRHGRSYTGISLSPSFPTRPLESLIWSS